MNKARIIYIVLFLAIQHVIVGVGYFYGFEHGKDIALGPVFQRIDEQCPKTEGDLNEWWQSIDGNSIVSGTATRKCECYT
jgi:hypothetical protein